MWLVIIPHGRVLSNLSGRTALKFFEIFYLILGWFITRIALFDEVNKHRCNWHLFKLLADLVQTLMIVIYLKTGSSKSLNKYLRVHCALFHKFHVVSHRYLLWLKLDSAVDIVSVHELKVRGYVWFPVQAGSKSLRRFKFHSYSIQWAPGPLSRGRVAVVWRW